MTRLRSTPRWSAFSTPTAGTTRNTGSKGWGRIVAQAGPAYLWEWLIMDRTTDWAGLFTDEHRWKVAVAVAHTLKRL
jgi:hypothetical protein